MSERTWADAMGVEFIRATKDEVVLEVEIGEQHRQHFGLIHGGVHTGLIETAASLGAFLVEQERGRSVVGLENHTSFVRAARAGRVRVVATPITRGRTTQVWEANVRDADDRILATGRVRLLCVDAPKPDDPGSA